MSTATAQKLATSKKIYTNMIWNICSMGLPMLIALICIPLFIKNLGIEKFGILTIIWSLIGYFGIFDMGMGKALTQKVSTCLGNNDTKSIPAFFWSAMSVTLCFGILGCALLLTTDFYILPMFLKTNKVLLLETQTAIKFIAVFFPFYLLNIGIKGIFDSFQKFRFTSSVTIIISICNFVLPLFVFSHSKSLVWVIAPLILGRLITLFCYFVYLSKLVPGLFSNISVKISHIKSLTSFGAWITVSNIVGPLMVYFDRFFIAGMLSASVIAYYTTPFELAFRFFVIPTAIFSVLFPFFTQAVTSDYQKAKKIYMKSFWEIFALMLVITIFVVIFAKSGLSLWISPDFAANSYRITQILMIGVLLFSITVPSFNFMQAIGRADVSAIIHLIELPIYLIILFIFIKCFGIIGAAISWTLRGAMDFILYSCWLKKLLKKVEMKNV